MDPDPDPTKGSDPFGSGSTTPKVLTTSGNPLLLEPFILGERNCTTSSIVSDVVLQ